MYEPEVTKARQLANSIISKTNDLYSYNKDVIRDKSFFNYVFILQQRSTLKESIEQVLVEINNEYKQLCSIQCSNIDNSIIIKRLIILCQGSFYWHNISKRYV